MRLLDLSIGIFSRYVPPMSAARRPGEKQNWAPLRLRPEMASLRLQVLAFVRGYITHWGDAPSYGEIAAATGTNRTRVKSAVRRLVADGHLLQAPGTRGLALPERVDDALALLRRLGWSIETDDLCARAPGITNPTLIGLDLLDYAVADRRDGDDDGQQGKSARD